MSKRLLFLIMLLSLPFMEAKASHIVGGELTYRFIKDTVEGLALFNRYEVSLTIYEDCLTGSPGAIADDNPACIGVFSGSTRVILDTNAFFTSSVPVPANFSNSCVSNIPATCLLKKTFVRTYDLRSSTLPYVIAYQRCCRNESVINIVDPSGSGSTFYCVIPPSTVVSHNNSAIFKNYPPQIICLNNPLYYDHSATDADGDSLSYGFCSALDGADDPSNAKPYPIAPPYDSVTYINPPFTAQHPFTGFPPIQINPSTGMITGTPNAVGRYLVAVFCNEYRDGTLINTIKREFQFVVTPCTKVVVADIPQYSTDPNTYIVECSGFTVHFVNTSTGGFSYHWDFGVAGSSSDTSDDFEPTFTFPDTGTYSVKLVVNPGSTCPDSILRFVKIYPYFKADFSDSGRQCPGVPISFKDLSSSTIKPINYWKWYFGDGDTTLTADPSHSYKYGGSYNVVFIAANVKNCIDTIVEKVIVEDFKPFAGNDTIIVKGESVQFDATGGTNYSWSPGTNLNATDIYNPLGYYPDTGTFTYYVFVTSEFGCSGYDTIKVSVVNQAEFFIPTAFTPNGDGLNDLFRPVAVGYRSLTYFRVFNRWGEMVYNSNILESGWDGNYDNHRAEMGTYYWEIAFVDRFGKQSTLKGDVTLVR